LFSPLSALLVARRLHAEERMADAPLI